MARGKFNKKVSNFRDRNKCRFCRLKVDEIDYKDVQTLTKLSTTQGKLFSRKRSGNCATHQRSARTAIKRSRFIGLMPFVG
jgi:small subunit ribosomal protein S18